MKVLVTGASGFVGSHIVDALCARKLDVAVLLRPASDRRFLAQRLPGLDVRLGSMEDEAGLRAALAGVTHVIHCAGLTKALDVGGFFACNQAGTERLVAAVNAHAGTIQRLVHISSLAAGGPALPERPAREEDPPRPVSAYGASKLGGEQAVRERGRVPYVILRPPAVYGPRDDGFLSLFQAVKRHVVPRFVGSLAALSMVYAPDLAAAAVACLEHPAAANRTYYVASPAVLRGEAFAREIARQMGTWTVTMPLPAAVLWCACALQQAMAALRRRPHIMGLQKYRELRAPGWVCDPARLREEVGYEARTPHAEAIAETLGWYRQEGWL